MFEQLLSKGEKVLICIMRNDILDESNPFTLDERMEMFYKTFTGAIVSGLMSVLPIPPIASVNVGRKCGYDLRHLDSRGKEGISASKIREQIREGRTRWIFDVPVAVHELIQRKRVSEDAKEK